MQSCGASGLTIPVAERSWWQVRRINPLKQVHHARRPGGVGGWLYCTLERPERQPERRGRFRQKEYNEGTILKEALLRITILAYGSRGDVQPPSKQVLGRGIAETCPCLS